MNIYFAAVGVAVVLASYAGTFYVGADYGENKALARAASTQEIADSAAEKSAQIAAQAISGIEIKHQTINQKVIREIQNNPVYVDCRHTDGVLRALNEALTGRPNTAPAVGVPAADGAPRQLLRRDNPKATGLGLRIPPVSPVNRP